MKLFKKRNPKIELTKQEVSLLIDAISDRITYEEQRKLEYDDLPFICDSLEEYMALYDKFADLYFDGKLARL